MIGENLPEWLHPIGERPHGALRAVGFVVVAVLYCALFSMLVPMLVSLLLFGLVPETPSPFPAFALGLAWIVANSLAIPFLLLVNSVRLPRVRWATWWVLLVDALLRILSAILALAGVPKVFYRYGSTNFLYYDFKQTSPSWAIASFVTAACTLVILGIFSRRESQAVTQTTNLSQEPSAT